MSEIYWPRLPDNLRYVWYILFSIFEACETVYILETYNRSSYKYTYLNYINRSRSLVLAACGGHCILRFSRNKDRVNSTCTLDIFFKQTALYPSDNGTRILITTHGHILEYTEFEIRKRSKNYIFNIIRCRI